MSFVECQATETHRTERSSHIPEDPAQVGMAYTYGQLYVCTKCKTVQFKSKFQHTGTRFAVTSLQCRLRNRLAVFFRHSLLIVFSVPQGEILCAFQKCYFVKFLLLCLRFRKSEAAQL